MITVSSTNRGPVAPSHVVHTYSALACKSSCVAMHTKCRTSRDLKVSYAHCRIDRIAFTAPTARVHDAASKVSHRSRDNDVFKHLPRLSSPQSRRDGLKTRTNVSFHRGVTLEASGRLLWESQQRSLVRGDRPRVSRGRSRTYVRCSRSTLFGSLAILRG
jgi:hypothetical protein